MAAADNYIPLHLKNFLDNEINDGEQLLWAAQPGIRQALRRAIRSSVPVLFFGLAWLGFISFIAYMVLTDPDVPLLAIAFISPFMLIGALLLSVPYWKTRWTKKTIYAVTNKRAIIIKKTWGSVTVERYGPEKLDNMDKRERSDGSGDLLFFGITSLRDCLKKASSGQKVSLRPEIGFFGIPKVNDVYDILVNMTSQNAGKA